MSSLSRSFFWIRSIRGRLLLWLLIPLIGLCGLSTFVAYKLAKTFANQSHDELLLNSADSIAGRIRRNKIGVVVADLPTAAQAILRRSGRDSSYYQIVDSKGHRLAGDSILPLPRNMSLEGAQFRYASIEGVPIRICRIPLHIAPSRDEIWVQYAQTLNSRKRLQNEIFLSIVAPQLLLVVLASFSAWLGICKGLAPLRRLGQLLNSREKLDLSPIELGDDPEELAPLKQALNDLFLRARHQIELQRQFVGNAAHQLRTPVTAMKTYIDYAERAKDGADLTEVIGQMSEATERVVRLINQLLLLARTEGNTDKVTGVADLAQAATNAGNQLVHEALRRRVQMDFEVPQIPVMVTAEQGDLEDLVANIVDNAIKYSAKDGLGKIWVSVETGRQPKLRVENNGEGIKDSEKQKIFERFYRVPGTQVSGCGLGLSIVVEIADRCGATINVSDRIGGGTIFLVAFSNVSSCPH